MSRCLFFFFFSSRRRHTRCSRDWSSDVCSSDLINPDDIESDRPRVAGVVVRELSVQPSNWRSTGALAEWLAAARIPLVADVDPPQITRHIRSKGAMRGAAALGEQPNAAARTPLAARPPT